ncbi:MAG: hypothetical protein E7490_04425 [Ruminococcaceae bacterium]|nr:hypothetical protein [Oscillospiraceae bacterium]
MKKKIMSFLIVIAFAFCGAGCSITENQISSSNDNLLSDVSDSTSTTTSTEQTSATVTSIPETTTIQSEEAVTSMPETTTTQSEETVTSESDPPKELTENEQILKILYDYSHFIFITSFPVNKWNFDIAYEEDKIYIDMDTNEVISSPEDAQRFNILYRAKESWINELNGMVTENMKKNIVNERVYVYQNEWYIRPTGGGGGIGLGQSELILDSYEKPDENTLILNFTCIGYKEDWGTDEDLIEEEQVILKKTENGYLIDQCHFYATELLARFPKLKYGSEYYNIRIR